uniref:EGF-like domain-containing protein n=1 Tax=Clastoptera arizonana TaxID=38151 RepID=A0A1B6CAX7_9HEMI
MLVMWDRTCCRLCFTTISSSFYRFLARFSGRRRWGGLRLLQGRMPPLLPATLLVLSSILAITEACSSRSTPKPRPPSPTARPNITFHTYKCPPEYAAWFCLNGATCFTVKIGEQLLYNCECADGYMGQRCEFKDLDEAYLPNRQRVMLEKASIASGATIAVFLVVVVCVSVYIHYQRKRKQNRATSCVDGSGHVGDIERRPPQPFARRPNQPLYQLSRITTERYGASLGKGDCPSATLYVHQNTPSVMVQAQPTIHDRAPP